jgi:hypothetical protein
MIDMTEITLALISLAGALITAFLVPYIRKNTTAKQREEINEWIYIACTAAEQIYSGVGQGKVKKQYVLNFLQSKGVKLDDASVTAMLEAAVYALKNVWLTEVEE